MKYICFSLFLLITLFLFSRFGKSILYKFYGKVQKVETTESISLSLEEKVKKSLSEKLSFLRLSNFPQKIKILAFKEERILQVYVLKGGKYHFLKEYPFTASSGDLGPKLREGDKQIPEGIYQIEYLNPNSRFYLSMKINYPNEFDKLQAKKDNRTNLGFDIFIHGKDLTIGCIPIGDEAIEELFVLATHAINQNIEVIISPRNFNENPSEPIIDKVSWEKELYHNIKVELAKMADQNHTPNSGIEIKNS